MSLSLFQSVQEHLLAKDTCLILNFYFLDQFEYNIIDLSNLKVNGKQKLNFVVWFKFSAKKKKKFKVLTLL